VLIKSKELGIVMDGATSAATSTDSKTRARRLKPGALNIGATIIMAEIRKKGAENRYKPDKIPSVDNSII
jgi:hypothetical protein